MKKKATAKRNGRAAATVTNGMIDFNFKDTLYQIDTTRRKVYHRWVEVETAKTYLIMGAYSHAQVRAD